MRDSWGNREPALSARDAVYGDFAGRDHTCGFGEGLGQGALYDQGIEALGVGILRTYFARAAIRCDEYEVLCDERASDWRRRRRGASSPMALVARSWAIS